jgi:hypothetical protein
MAGHASLTDLKQQQQKSRREGVREFLIRDLIKQKIFPPYCIKMFLHNMDQSLIPIVRFINSIGIYI